MTVETYIPSIAILSAETEETDFPFIIILRDPQDGETGISQTGLISFYIVRLLEDPATTSPYTISCAVEISLDDGENWNDAYTNGTFYSPYDGGSSSVDLFGPADPFVFNKITIDYTGTYDDSSTVMVRVTYAVSGWGHDPWMHFPWGHASDTENTDEWSFEIEDLTAPKLLSAVPIDRKTIRVTFDDDMRSTTPDGRAVVQTTVSETWNMSSGGETLQVIVDNGSTQEVTFQTYMWLDPAAVTDDELADALTALVDGGEAEADGSGGVYLYSETVGDGSTIQVTGGTANSLFGFPTTQTTGTSEGVLDVENYTIARQNVYPAVAVNLEVEAAEFLEDSLSVVDLTCQWEMTPEAPYQLTVDGDVADTSNNDIDPSYVTADFTGFEPDWPAERDAEIKLPQVVWDGDPLEVARAVLNMLQEIEDLKITDVDELWDLLWNVDNVNMPTVELMLYDMGNPFSTLDLTDDQKKKLVELLPYIYQQKGLATGLTSTIMSLMNIPLTVEDYITNSWRLGHGVLGDNYPASIWCSNQETYNLLNGGTLLVRVDGGDVQTITFENNDFANPSLATAVEAALVIDTQLDGGAANVFDDGSGHRIEIISTTWGPSGTISVEGGTFTSVFGFDTSSPYEWSGSGSCMLGPASGRLVRTFDLVYSSVVPSSSELEQIRKIATYMKPVNAHLGNIRAAKTIPEYEYWRLGYDFLGSDTVLGG